MKQKKSLKKVKVTVSSDNTQNTDDNFILSEMIKRFGRAFNLRRYDPSF